MEKVKVKLILDDNGQGQFQAEDDHHVTGKIIVGIEKNLLTAYHTEVDPAYEGKGVATQMFTALVDYAHEKHLLLVPLCPYVHARLKRRPEDYADIWRP